MPIDLANLPHDSSVLWFGFGVVIIAMLALDLGVLNRNAHAIKLKEAFWTSMLWIAVSLAFNAVVFWWLGFDKGLEFLTGYLIEKALSVDNLFVFLVIFAYFHVEAHVQHRVLFWGILGAIIMRGALITLGVALIHQFEWLVYVFGVFLIYTGYKLATQKETGVNPEKNPVVNLFRRFLPVSKNYEGAKFLTRIDGKLIFTPLMIVLLVVETTDLAFALDSIPAIFAITTDPFIIFTSNIFAILGLRALYFLIAGVLGMFKYLKIGLALVLSFVGVKMIIAAIDVKIPIGLSLGIIAGILTLSIVASIISAKREGNLRVKSFAEAGKEALAEAAHPEKV